MRTQNVRRFQPIPITIIVVGIGDTEFGRSPIRSPNRKAREQNMTEKLTMALIAWLTVGPLCMAQEDTASATAPQFLIDAEIIDDRQGEVFIAARLYFDQIEQSFHVDSQRDRTDLANRHQELSILQSQLVQFSVRGLQFQTVDGKTLSPDEARARLEDKPAVLLMPKDATIHPAIKATLNPDALVISKVRGARPMKLVTRPTSR
jgi:hypothetical protein